MAVDLKYIKDRWPTEPFPYRDSLVQSTITDAMTELREEIPNLDALLATGAVSLESVDKVVGKAVIGALRNIDGFKSESEGDYSYSRYGDGFVWYRKSDIDRLVRRTSAVRSIPVGLPCSAVQGVWR